MLRNAMGGGGVSFPSKKVYEGVRINVISITRGWVEIKFSGKKHYITLEWPQTQRKRSDTLPNCTQSLIPLEPSRFNVKLPGSPDHPDKNGQNWMLLVFNFL